MLWMEETQQTERKQRRLFRRVRARNEDDCYRVQFCDWRVNKNSQTFAKAALELLLSPLQASRHPRQGTQGYYGHGVFS